MTPPQDARAVVPMPDPTLLTTQQLIRENVWLREVLETRLNGMDKAIELLQATADKFPARMDEKIAALAGVHDEKFSNIQTQFGERDVRDERSSRDSKVAVDAALSAAKELVAQQNLNSERSITKSETATFKQIDQLGALIETTSKASDEKIADVKDRLTRIEGKGEGAAVAKTGTQASIGTIVGIVGAGVGAVGLILVLMKGLG